MSIKTAVGILAVACLMLLGVVVFLVLRPVPASNTYPTSAEATISQQVAAQQQQEQIESQKTLEPVSETTQTPVVDCAQTEKEKILAQGMEYAPGSLLVSFPLSTSFAQAASVVAEYGLTPATGAEGTFATSHWFRVDVEKGGEFEWICTLKVDSRIKYITIDPILYLNQ